MECEQLAEWLDAYVDLELEPEQAAALVRHARTCSGCARAVHERQQLRSALISGMEYHPAPGETLAKLRELAPSSHLPLTGKTPRWAWASVAAALLLAGALVGTLVNQRAGASAGRSGELEGVREGPSDVLREAVSAHIRSLMAAHLADIANSDQHVVKPWFTGKLEFSPRVVDFAAEGFPLAGGRLDYIAGRPAAAVVYSRRAHIINFFSCPDPGVDASAPRQTTDRGYTAIGWSEPGIRHCAVSDLNQTELMEFVRLASSRAADGR